jgi:hypothetical protein
MTAPRWLLLIHSIPPTPAYFRVKVGRRLRKLGAIGLKNSVYLLEHSEEAIEDLRWLAQEIRAGGGEAIIAATDMIDGPSDVELAARLRGVHGAIPQSGPRDMASLGEIRDRTWVTRRGIKVDRMASAWLIRTRIGEPTFASRVTMRLRNRVSCASTCSKVSSRTMANAAPSRCWWISLGSAPTPRWLPLARWCTISTARTTAFGAPRLPAWP